jgi:DME family drug/metabolite transporter
MRRGVLFVCVAAMAWGSGGVVAAVLYRTSGLGPVAVSFWRFACGAAIIAAVRYARPRSATRLGNRDRDRNGAGRRWWILAMTGAGMAVYQTAYYGAVAEAGVAVGTVVTIGAGPVLIALGARAALGERLGPRGAATIGVALVGLVLLAGDVGSGVGPRPVVGVGLALLSATGYAGITLLSRASAATGDPLDTALAGFGTGTLVLLPVALVEGIVPDGAGLAWTVGWLLYLGVVPTALGYGLFFAGLAAVPATTAAVVALVEPVTAAAVAVAVLGERLTPAVGIGTVVLLTAVAFLVIRPGPRPATG